VSGAIALAVVVVFMFGGSGSDSTNANTDGLLIDPLTPGPGRGIQARSVATATVREGPGLEYVAIGELSRNQDIEVVGRNEESSWYKIYFPPGSSLEGWVPASALRLPANSATIPITAVTPIPRPTIPVPTAPPAPTEGPTATATPTAMGTPAGGSDLVALEGVCGVGFRLLIRVANQGPAPIENRILSVLLQRTDGSQLASSAQSVSIPAGGQIPIDTGYTLDPTVSRVTVTVDPFGTLGDPNPGNNRVDCVVSVIPPPVGTGTPGPTRSPTSAVPPPIATTTRTVPGP
jgi:hypothetical protein